MTDSPLTDHSLDVIVALMPISALMLVCQVNPYNALVIRGILGAVAALVYAVLGAADVALTEALVGTMLAITLYAVAVRSSLVMRLGILQGESHQGTGDEGQSDHDALLEQSMSLTASVLPPMNDLEVNDLNENAEDNPQKDNRQGDTLMDHLRSILKKRYMRLECVTYPNQEALQQALIDKEVHGTCVRLGRSPLLFPHCPTLPHPDNLTLVSNTDKQADHLLIVRVYHLYNILSVELPPSDAVITYAKTPETPALAATVLNPKSRELAEEQL